MIARGAAMLALLLSSQRWKGARHVIQYCPVFSWLQHCVVLALPSYPDVVQIVVRKPDLREHSSQVAENEDLLPMMVDQPIGHTVPFSKEVQVVCVSLVFGALIDPAGNQMMKINTMIMFHTVPILLTQPMNQVDCVHTIPCITRSPTKVR